MIIGICGNCAVAGVVLVSPLWGYRQRVEDLLFRDGNSGENAAALIQALVEHADKRSPLHKQVVAECLAHTKAPEGNHSECLALAKKAAMYIHIWEASQREAIFEEIKLLTTKGD